MPLLRLPTVVAVVIGLAAASGCGREADPALPEGFAALAEARGDLDADGREETVRLVGRNLPGGSFHEDFRLVVGRSSRLWPLPSAAATGYGPTLQVVDVTGDGHEEILVTADTGGSGGLVNAAVIAARPAGGAWDLHAVFTSEAGPMPRLEGALAAGFRAELVITAPGLGRRTETLDLGGHRELYLRTGVYAADGALLREVAIWGDGLTAIAPITAAAGGPGLQLTQQPRGSINADRLAEVRTLLVWRQDRWEATAVFVLPSD